MPRQHSDPLLVHAPQHCAAGVTAAKALNIRCRVIFLMETVFRGREGGAASLSTTHRIATIMAPSSPEHVLPEQEKVFSYIRDLLGRKGYLAVNTQYSPRTTRPYIVADGAGPDAEAEIGRSLSKKAFAEYGIRVERAVRIVFYDDARSKELARR